MSAGRIAEMASLIREVFAYAEKHATSDEVLCATFSVAGRRRRACGRR